MTSTRGLSAFFLLMSVASGTCSLEPCAVYDTGIGEVLESIEGVDEVSGG